ncbi:MAG: ABC transporter permease, partial [Acidobacteria bacterium]|nr:ABC transporter permease [Acidobacteriota bacterium]
VGLATVTFTAEGKPVPVGNEPTADYRTISFDYFRTMGIALRNGREFTEHDKVDTPDAVIINEELARRFFPNEDPVGKRLQLGTEKTRFREIVGVVGNAKLTSLDGGVDPAIYVPQEQNTWPQALRISSFVIRTTVEPRGLIPSIRKELHSIDSSLPVTQLQTMEEIMHNSLAQRRFNLTLLMIFAAVAGLLAIVGIYGVMSYNVTQQTHELGVRMALGAQQSAILKMVVGDGAKLALAGVLIGLAGSLMMTRLMSGLLYGIAATDLVTFITIAPSLFAVSMLASFIPARRASKVNPIIALRGE